VSIAFDYGARVSARLSQNAAAASINPFSIDTHSFVLQLAVIVIERQPLNF
jgi:hypothetical protein